MIADPWRCDLACQANWDAITTMLVFAGIVLVLAVIVIVAIKWKG